MQTRKTKRVVIQHKKTGFKIVIHPVKKATISATLMQYILNRKGWQLGNVKVKTLCNT